MKIVVDVNAILLLLIGIFLSGQGGWGLHMLNISEAAMALNPPFGILSFIEVVIGLCMALFAIWMTVDENYK